MTDHGKPEHGKPGNHQNGDGFEREDIGTRPLFGFLISLLVTGVLVYYVIWGMFHFMDAYERKHQQTKSPMVQAAPNNEALREPETGRTRAEIRQAFPEPRLEDDEQTEINDFRYQQDETLSSYGWVDQGAGVVHVPIDRAMQLIAQRGLPTAQQAATEAANGAGSSQKTPATKRPEKEKSSEQ